MTSNKFVDSTKLSNAGHLKIPSFATFGANKSRSHSLSRAMTQSDISIRECQSRPLSGDSSASDTKTGYETGFTSSGKEDTRTTLPTSLSTPNHQFPTLSPTLGTPQNISKRPSSSFLFKHFRAPTLSMPGPRPSRLLDLQPEPARSSSTVPTLTLRSRISLPRITTPSSTGIPLHRLGRLGTPLSIQSHRSTPQIPAVILPTPSTPGDDQTFEYPSPPGVNPLNLTSMAGEYASSAQQSPSATGWIPPSPLSDGTGHPSSRSSSSNQHRAGPVETDATFSSPSSRYLRTRSSKHRIVTPSILTEGAI